MLLIKKDQRGVLNAGRENEKIYITHQKHLKNRLLHMKNQYIGTQQKTEIKNLEIFLKCQIKYVGLNVIIAPMTFLRHYRKYQELTVNLAGVHTVQIQLKKYVMKITANIVLNVHLLPMNYVNFGIT